MANGISGDELRDLRLNGDRQIQIGSDGDWETTDGIETVEQSVGISAGAVLRPLIGEPITGQTMADIQAELFEVLTEDPQIEDVQRVNVTEVNRTDGTVFVEVFTEYNNSFEIQVNPQ